MAALAQPVLNYATAGQFSPARLTVIVTRTLAILQMLLGIGAIIWSATIIFSFEGPLFISLPMMACGLIHTAVGWLLFRPRASNWKAARLMLAILLLPALAFVA